MNQLINQGKKWTAQDYSTFIIYLRDHRLKIFSESYINGDNVYIIELSDLLGRNIRSIFCKLNELQLANFNHKNQNSILFAKAKHNAKDNLEKLELLKNEQIKKKVLNQKQTIQTKQLQLLDQNKDCITLFKETNPEDIDEFIKSIEGEQTYLSILNELMIANLIYITNKGQFINTELHSKKTISKKSKRN